MTEARRPPLVTIGIPVYNGEDYLESALADAVGQTYPNIELIVSDNCSNDGTEGICRRFAAAHANIRYIRQPSNIGVLENMAFLTQAATGDYFAWLAADDGIDPSFIASLVEEFEAGPDLVLAGADVLMIDSHGQPIRVEAIASMRRERIEADWPRVQRELFKYNVDKRYMLIYGLYRTEAIRRCSLDCGGRLKWLSSVEIPFLAQVAAYGRILSSPNPRKIYRLNPSSSSQQEAARIPHRGMGHYLNIWRCLWWAFHAHPFRGPNRTLIPLYLAASFPLYVARMVKRGVWYRLSRRGRGGTSGGA